MGVLTKSGLKFTLLLMDMCAPAGRHFRGTGQGNWPIRGKGSGRRKSSSSCCYLLRDVRNINENQKKKKKKRSNPRHRGAHLFVAICIRWSTFVSDRQSAVPSNLGSRASSSLKFSSSLRSSFTRTPTSPHHTAVAHPTFGRSVAWSTNAWFCLTSLP